MHLFGSGRQEQIGFAAGGRGLSTPTEPNVAYDIYPALPMKVAVVGSGVSGLAATWLLNEYSDHEVHLYEADSRAGGHANTVSFTAPGVQNAQAVDVDTGFVSSVSDSRSSGSLPLPSLSSTPLRTPTSCAFCIYTPTLSPPSSRRQ